MATILTVDDQAASRELLATLLGYKDHRVLEARNGAEALERVREESPDLIIADLMMPQMDGYEFAYCLRSDPTTARIPMIFFSAGYDVNEARDLAHSCGVFHLLSKPSDPEVILRYVDSALQFEVPQLAPIGQDQSSWAQDVQTQHHRLLANKLTQQRTLLEHEISVRAEAEHEICALYMALEEREEANACLERLAFTDALTGLNNRRTFQACFDQEFLRARRYDAPLSLIIVDVDRFKLFNDTFGHLAGDRALKQVASLLDATVRDCDLTARFGGEEFAIILPNTDESGARAMAKRLRETIGAADWPGQSVTVSVGGASLNPSHSCPDDLIYQADRALYAAKQAGRNRDMHYEDCLACCESRSLLAA